jgi:AcrR family transcriptional regulator
VRDGPVPIIAAATSVADGEGLAAVSMRRIAIELGVATMALYRHVRGKNGLLLLMADTVLGEAPPPAQRPVGGRAQLEALGRLQWRVYQRHPWLARLLSMTRPSAMPNGMAHTEWALQAVKRVGLDPGSALQVVVALFGYVRGSAMNLEMPAEAEQETGLTDDEWMASQQAALTKSLASGRYPTLQVVASTPVDITPDTLFEFGLQRMLDGLGPFR